MDKTRLKKIEGTVLQLISEYIFSEMALEQEEFGMITVLGVKISSDLSYLDVYVSSLKNSEILPKALAKHGYEIQKRFNKIFDIYKIPKIRFRYDDSGRKSSEIIGIIDSL